MNRKISLFIIISLLLACASCARLAPAPDANSSAAQTEQNANQTKMPPADVVRVNVPETVVAAGESAEASVHLQIASGYHINANPPSFPYLIATELQLENNKDVTADSPIYPQAVTKPFKFAEKPLAVYEGDAVIRVPLKVENKKTEKGSKMVRAKLRVQACDQEACYPPRTIDTSIPVTVK